MRHIIRNTIFGYFGIGLIIAPEIYNPFLMPKPENIVKHLDALDENKDLIN